MRERMKSLSSKNLSKTSQAGISRLVVIIIISVVGVLIIAGGSLALLVTLKKKDNNGIAPAQSTQNLRDKADETKEFAADTPATFGPFAVTINKVSRHYKPGNNTEPKYPNEEFLLLDITIKNTSSTAQLLSETGLGLLVDDVLEVSSFITVEPVLELGVIEAGETRQGNLLYEVPSDAQNVQLYYNYDQYDETEQRMKKIEYTLDIDF